MGKNLITQRRGRGSPKYRSPSHRFQGEVHFPSSSLGMLDGRVVDLVHCPGHSSPLMRVLYSNGETNLAFAPEGIKVGDAVRLGGGDVALGCVLPLGEIPEGTLIHNIELCPGDGGKLVRASGSSAKIISKGEEGIRVKLPSRQEKLLLPECRAAIGVLAGGGRPEKPFLKAGNMFYRMRARNHLYPIVCGISKNAVDHPFGGKCSHQKGRPTQSSRNAPPGRKVGKIAPSRTGRRNR